MDFENKPNTPEDETDFETEASTIEVLVGAASSRLSEHIDAGSITQDYAKSLLDMTAKIFEGFQIDNPKEAAVRYIDSMVKNLYDERNRILEGSGSEMSANEIAGEPDRDVVLGDGEVSGGMGPDEEIGRLGEGEL